MANDLIKENSIIQLEPCLKLRVWRVNQYASIVYAAPEDDDGRTTTNWHPVANIYNKPNVAENVANGFAKHLRDGLLGQSLSKEDEAKLARADETIAIYDSDLTSELKVSCVQNGRLLPLFDVIYHKGMAGDENSELARNRMNYAVQYAIDKVVAEYGGVNPSNLLEDLSHGDRTYLTCSRPAHDRMIEAKSFQVIKKAEP